MIFQEIGDQHGEGNALGNLGITYANQGDVHKAIRCFEQALAIRRKIDDRQGEAINSWNLDSIYEEQGDLRRAVQLMQVCVDYERSIGHPDAEKHAALVEKIRRRMTRG